MFSLKQLSKEVQSAMTTRIMYDPPSEKEMDKMIDKVFGLFELSDQQKECYVKIRNDCSEKKAIKFTFALPYYDEFPYPFLFSKPDHATSFDNKTWYAVYNFYPFKRDCGFEGDADVSIPSEQLADSLELFAAVDTTRAKETPWRDVLPELDEPIDDYELDGRAFWNLLIALDSYMQRKLRREFLQHREHPVHIIDVGCGAATDADPLVSWFGNAKYSEEGSNVDYFGIDIASYQIDSLKSAAEGKPNMRFEIADATNFKKHPFLRRLFDVIVIRHPEVFDRSSYCRLGYISPHWYAIYREALDHLAPNGTIIVTNFTEEEFGATKEALACLGGSMIYSAQNQFSSPNVFYITIGFRDNFVAIYQKR